MKQHEATLDAAAKEVPDIARRWTPRRGLKRRTQRLEQDVGAAELLLGAVKGMQIELILFGDRCKSFSNVSLGCIDRRRELDTVILKVEYAPVSVAKARVIYALETHHEHLDRFG